MAPRPVEGYAAAPPQFGVSRPTCFLFGKLPPPSSMSSAYYVFSFRRRRRRSRLLLRGLQLVHDIRLLPLLRLVL